MPPKDYRDKGYPVGKKPLSILKRWRPTRQPKHFLASVIAPHVFAWQEPGMLMSGRPVHMLITRSLMSQCRQEHEWVQVAQLKYEKRPKVNQCGTRDKANVGLRLTNIFRQVIFGVVKGIPDVF
jgi:hypothetical protein